MTRTAITLIAIAALGSMANAASAQEGPAWSQFQGGPGHPGVLADGPQPPYRVAWTLPATEGEALSGAIVVGGQAVSVGSEAVYGIDPASGDELWEVARDGGPLSVPAAGRVGGRTLLLYLEGPAPDGGLAEPTPSPTSSVPSPAASTPSASPDASPSPSPASEEGAGADVSAVVALSLGDRSERWRTPLEGLSRSGVTIEGETAYVGDQNGNVYAISMDSGAIAWTAKVEGRVDSSIAVADGNVYAVGRDYDNAQVTIAAFDAASGEPVWPSAMVLPNSTAGSAPAAGGGVVVVGSADRQVRALTAEDGSDRWSSLVLSLFSPATAPAFDGADLYIADISSGLYRFDASDGTRRWSYQLNDTMFRSSPVVSGASVLLGLGDGRLVAVDGDSGHLVWQGEPSPGLVGTIALSTDVVIAVKGGRNAGLIAFEHDPEGSLVDVPSPTELDPGTTLSGFAIAAVIVFGLAVLAGRLAMRRFGSPAIADEPSRAGGAEPDDEPEPDDESELDDVDPDRVEPSDGEER